MAPRPPDADEPPGGEPRDEEQGTSPDDADVQRRFEQIVAQLREPDEQPHDTDPEVHDTEAQADGFEVRPPGTGDPRSWSPDPAVAEQEDHFVPPDPGPVLGGDPLLTMAWTAVVGVPVVLLLAYLVAGGLATTASRIAGALWVAGLAVLVWRMPRDRSPDDGPGAVV